MTIVATNREMMTGYVDALLAREDFAQYFTDDVTFEVAWNGPRAEGRQAVEAMIRYLHEQAFDANPELKQMTVDGYYTSATAIHQDMEYLGNTYLAAFPECTHPEHQD